MQRAFTLAENVMTQYALGSQASARIGAGLAAGTVFLTGCVFIAVGFLFWLMTMYEPHIAALITGLVLSGIGLLILGVLKLRAQAKINRQKRRQQEMLQIVEDAWNEYAQYSDEAVGIVRRNPKQSILIAMAAGFLASEIF